MFSKNDKGPRRGQIDAVTVLAVIVAILFGYAMFAMGSGLMGKGENATAEIDPSAVLLSALSKQASYSIYTYDYAEDDNGLVTYQHIVEAPTFTIVRSSNIFFNKTVYSNASGDVLCVKYGQREACSSTLNESDFITSAGTSKGLLLSRNAKAGLDKVNKSIAIGAIKFIGAAVETEVAGKPCTQIEYARDYSNLTLEDLNNLGIPANSAEALLVSNFTYTACITNQSDFVNFGFTYLFSGKPMETQVNVTRNGWGNADSSEFSFPATVNASVTRQIFLDALTARNSVLACSENETTKDACIRAFAVENSAPDICLLAGGQKDKCILTLAPSRLRSDLCAKVGNASLRDDCWTEMAGRANDSAYCANVSDAQSRDYCLGLGQLNGTECSKDSDCVSAGCSKQLCVPLSQKGVITTCEYRPEYACLKYSGCGCQPDGTCGWAQTSNYTECLEGILAKTNSSFGNESGGLSPQ